MILVFLEPRREVQGLCISFLIASVMGVRSWQGLNRRRGGGEAAMIRGRGVGTVIRARSRQSCDFSLLHLHMQIGQAPGQPQSSLSVCMGPAFLPLSLPDHTGSNPAQLSLKSSLVPLVGSPSTLTRPSPWEEEMSLGPLVEVLVDERGTISTESSST